MCKSHYVTYSVCDGVTGGGKWCLNPPIKNKTFRGDIMLCKLHAYTTRECCIGTTKKGRFCNNYPYKYGDGYCRIHSDPDVIKINKEDEDEISSIRKKKSNAKLNKEALENRLNQDRIDKLQLELDSLIVMIGMNCNLKLQNKDIRKLDGKMYFLKIYNAGYYEVKGKIVNSFESKGVEEDRNTMLQLVADLIGYRKPKDITPKAMYQELLTITLKIFHLKKNKKKSIRRILNLRDIYNKQLKRKKNRCMEESIERKRKEREDGCKTEEEIISAKKTRCNKLRKELRIRYNCPLPMKLRYMGDMEMEREFTHEYSEIISIEDDIGPYPENIILPEKGKWEINNEKQDYHSDNTVNVMMDPNRERDKGVMIRGRLLKSNHDVKAYNNLPRDYKEWDDKKEPCSFCDKDEDSDNECDVCKGTRIVSHTNRSELSDNDLQPFLHYTALQKSKIEDRDYVMKHNLKICAELIDDYNNFITKCRELNCSPLKYLYMFEKFVFDYDKP
uniref:Uncharacterized protein n=1 Tax=Pithovirus LCPAC401 TaxID=2506595 RepID=A0A481ZA95_9VIRU|nr:MAG: uncharacterized protein LCPAC401_03450 [Pithovirus LCPAC401]